MSLRLRIQIPPILGIYVPLRLHSAPATHVCSVPVAVRLVGVLRIIVA